MDASTPICPCLPLNGLLNALVFPVLLHIPDPHHFLIPVSSSASELLTCVTNVLTPSMTLGIAHYRSIHIRDMAGVKILCAGSGGSATVPRPFSSA